MADPIEIPADLWRRLHHLHNQRGDLQRQVDRGPLQIAAAQAIVDKSQAAVSAIESSIAQATQIADRKQAHLKDRETQVATLQAKLNTAASNKEFTLLEDQIESDRSANEVLSDEILEVLEKIDSLRSDAEAARRQHQDDIDAKTQREAAVRERLKTVHTDLAATEAKLATEEQRIPDQVRPLYQRMIAGRGADAMAGGEGGSCDGCHQTLRPMVIDQLKLNRLVQCQSCQALMYL